MELFSLKAMEDNLTPSFEKSPTKLIEVPSGFQEEWQ